MYKTSPIRALGAPGLGGDEAQVLRRAGVGDGLPFVLGPDGSYDLELNRFVRELEGWGVRSEHSKEAYARDLMLFGRFLHEHRGGRSIWDAEQDDLRAYKRARRRTKGFTVSASTWNRFIVALDKWVKWAMHEQLIDAQPFRMVEKTVLTPRGLARCISTPSVRSRTGPGGCGSWPTRTTWCGGTCGCGAAARRLAGSELAWSARASATGSSLTCWCAPGCGCGRGQPSGR
ncbi:site-specific integrase [Kibdelosporangium philippinense]|uniref:site-specific integrase n=1 Tax=Kibdelosporangium philippinense TaxID=211113 RepID=UPI0036082339